LLLKNYLVKKWQQGLADRALLLWRMPLGESVDSGAPGLAL
jgi:hypothetical protein